MATKKVEPLVMRIKITFIEECLGTASGDPDIHGTYIAGKINDAKKNKKVYNAMTDEERDEQFNAEMDAVRRLDYNTEMQKGKLYFPRDEHGNPVMFGYQVKGFFKSACAACRQIGGSLSSEFKAYKGKIDTLIHVYPDYMDPSIREIIILDKNLNTPKIGDCQRSLRASTAQGDRVALADSESVPAGCSMEMDIVDLAGDKDREMIEEWLDLGRYHGLGGWRNSGKGRFVWDYVEEVSD